MDYTSHSDIDRKRMLSEIGLDSVKELINRIIPGRFLSGGGLDLPDGIAEISLFREFKDLAGENQPAENYINLLGGGSYDHYIPAAINHIVNRSEFATAYTPYQAEVAQGTLQTIYEFQTMICRLTGMYAANASHYDGATALAEGVLLAVRNTKRSVIVVPYGLNPAYRQVLKTYCDPTGIEIRQMSRYSGVSNIEELKKIVEGAGAVVIQHPNYLGLLEPVESITQIAHDAGAKVVASTYPVSLSLLKPPGEWGADITTAEGQSLGIPMALGGPYVGLFAVTKPLLRMMPGRLVARAKDKGGRDGYVLTLQTREQHIRREKATSNICTNQALVALASLVYLSLVGSDGLKRVALNSYRGAHYLARKLNALPGCNLMFDGEFFNEFVVQLPVNGREIQNRLLEKGIYIGPTLDQWFPELGNSILIAVTEKRTRKELDDLADSLNDIIK